MTGYLSIPENFYAVADVDTKVLLPDVITCMGICITAHNNRKIVLHYADLPGYPSKKLDKKIHPLPFQFLATEKLSGVIFEFLLKKLAISSSDIKNVTVFGYYRIRTDVFPGGMNDFISDELIQNQVSSQLHIAPEQIQLIPCRYTDYGINGEGQVIVLSDASTYAYDRIEQIASENIRFYEQNKHRLFNSTVILANCNRLQGQQNTKKVYSLDDSAVMDFDDPALRF